jgi:hypothetical protein
MKIISTLLLLSLLPLSLGMFIPNAISKLFGRVVNDELHSNAARVFTQKEFANIEYAFASLSLEYKTPKLLALMKTPEIEVVLQDQEAAVILYDRLARLNLNDHSEFMKHLKEKTFNRFPERFVAAEEIYAYKWSRPEVLEFLLESKPFLEFMKDESEFTRLLGMLTTKLETMPEYDFNLKSSRFKLETLYTDMFWLSKASSGDNLGSSRGFLKYLSSEEIALKLLRNLRKLPKIHEGTILAVKKAAFHRSLKEFSPPDVDKAAKIALYFQENGGLDVLNSFGGYTAFIKDQVQASRLQKLLSKLFVGNSPEQVKFMTSLQKAAERDFFNSNDVLRSLKNADYDLSVLLNTKNFQKYIDNTAKMFALVKTLNYDGDRLELISLNTNFDQLDRKNLKQKKFLELLKLEED